MVSRVPRVRRIDCSMMLGVGRGCTKAQGLMEAEGSETEEVTWSDGDDDRVGPKMTRTEANVGDRDRRSQIGDRRSDDGDRRSEVCQGTTL
jgi:hypothetical protein